MYKLKSEGAFSSFVPITVISDDIRYNDIHMIHD